MLFGIVLFLCFSCKTTIEPPLVKGKYVYINTLNEPVQLRLRNLVYDQVKIDTIIQVGGSFVIEQTTEGPPMPFRKYNADSIIIWFNNNKCLSYVQERPFLPDMGSGVFNLQNYKNYNNEILSQRNFELVYEIGEKDRQLAHPCL